MKVIAHYTAVHLQKRMRTYKSQKLNHNIIMVKSTLQKKNACSYKQHYQVEVKI